MAATMKNAVLWTVTPCGSCKNRCLGGTNRPYPEGGISGLGKMLTVTSSCYLPLLCSQRADSFHPELVTANVVPSSLILS
jgi:hypothetical protein